MEIQFVLTNSVSTSDKVFLTYADSSDIMKKYKGNTFWKGLDMAGLQAMVKANLSTSVKNRLTKYIKSLDTSGSMKLPPESELSNQLGVSRITIRRALDELEQEGSVIRIHGRGTFANPEATDIRVNLMPGAEFRSLIRSCGYKPRAEIIGIQKFQADEKLSRILKIEIGTEMYKIEKAYYADDKLAIISIDRFACDLIGVELEPEHFDEKSVFDILLNYGSCFIARDKIEIEAVPREKVTMSKICKEQMECDSLLVFHGVNYNQENMPVMYDTEYYNTDIVKFNLIRVKNIYTEQN